jgi:hypothetical protein
MFQEWKKQLTGAEKAILNYTYNYWTENLEWPKNIDVEIKCRTKFKNNEDLYSVVDQLGYNFIRCGKPHQLDPVTELKIFGIALCDNSDEDIDLFLKIMKQYVSDFIKNPSSNFQININNFDSDKYCKKVCYLLNAAGYDLFSFRSKSNCNFTLKTDIWKFEHVKTIEDYYDKARNNLPERFSKSEDKSIKIEENKIEGIGLNISEKNNICFVISPIGKEGTDDHDKFKEVLDYVIKPAIDDSGHDLEVLRADEINRTGSLIKDILENVYGSFIVIADLTGQNPNVFYELGVRHSLKPRTILITQSMDDVPFDIRDYRTIKYDTSAKGANTFKNKLKSYLNEIFENPNHPDNPVLNSLGNVIDHRIIELEKENKELREFKRQDNELREAIKAISKPKKEKHTPDEDVEVRLDRILKIRNMKKDYGYQFYKKTKNMIEVSSQGHFSLYILDEDHIDEIYYISSDLTASNYQIELADIRVLIEECSKIQKLRVIFIMVTNDDLSAEKDLIEGKFNKMKEFINEKSRDLFSLEIWDKSVLLEKEKELGIRI